MKRYKTDYPGVFFREAKRIGGKGIEKVYYVVYKKNGKVHEEKAGRQYADDMTPARAAGIRAELIEGKRLTRKEKRKQEQAIKVAEAHKWTTDRLFDEYIKGRPNNKARATDKGRYNNYLTSVFGAKEPKDIL
ncbi:MAG: site-specific integrase, partial [Desulfobacterales bacterium]